MVSWISCPTEQEIHVYLLKWVYYQNVSHCPLSLQWWRHPRRCYVSCLVSKTIIYFIIHFKFSSSSNCEIKMCLPEKPALYDLVDTISFVLKYKYMPKKYTHTYSCNDINCLVRSCLNMRLRRKSFVLISTKKYILKCLSFLA